MVTDATDESARPSKSQRKREMEGLQALGVELVALNTDQLAKIELPERLLDAIEEARRISDFEGRRRQMQYIGKLMRDVNPAPIRMKLALWKSAAHAHTAAHDRAEEWRTRLLGEEGALRAFADLYGETHNARLSVLVAGVKRDRAAGRPAKGYRELFRIVRTILDKPGGDT